MMTTGKDYGLPVEYADWVEVTDHKTWLDLHYGPPLGKNGCLKIEETIHYPIGAASLTRYFVPPKPKPTLPDVGPGAIVRYVDKNGLSVRAVHRSAHVWDTYRQPSAPLNTACTIVCLLSSALLEDVNKDGFTVELDGLA